MAFFLGDGDGRHRFLRFKLPILSPFRPCVLEWGFGIDGYDEGGGELGRIGVLGVRGLGC